MRNALLIVCFTVLYVAGYMPFVIAAAYIAALPMLYREWLSWLWMLAFLAYMFFSPLFILERVNDVINRRPRG